MFNLVPTLSHELYFMYHKTTYSKEEAAGPGH